MSSLVVYISRGALSATRWCVVSSMRRTSLSRNAHPARSCANAAFAEPSFSATSFANRRAPPTNAARAPPRVWKPVAADSCVPAHRPSPPRSAASTIASAPLSLSASLANASGGARRSGTRYGFVPSACAAPANQTGPLSADGESAGCHPARIGTSQAGSGRCGKWLSSGVPGGGRMSPNSAASDVSGVCFVPSAKRMFVPLPRRSTSDCGVMSCANAGVCERGEGKKRRSQYEHFVSGANRMMWLNAGSPSTTTAGVASLGARKVRLYPFSATVLVSHASNQDAIVTYPPIHRRRWSSRRA
jgi:hypothetical protein